MSDYSDGSNNPTLNNAESAATHENDKQMAGMTDVIQSARNGSDALGNRPAGGCPAIMNDVCESQETLNAGMQDRSENLASSSDTSGGDAYNLEQLYSNFGNWSDFSETSVNGMVTQIGSFATQPEREKPQSQIQDDSKQTFDKGHLLSKQASFIKTLERFNEFFTKIDANKNKWTPTPILIEPIISTSARSKSLVEDDVAGGKKSTTLDSVEATSGEENHEEQPPVTMNLVEEEKPAACSHLQVPGSSPSAHSDVFGLNPDDGDDDEHGVAQERAVEGTSGNDGIAVVGEFENLMDTEPLPPTMKESKRRRAPSETENAYSIEGSESSSIKRSKPTESTGKRERPATVEISLDSGSDSAIQDQASYSAEQPSSCGTSSQHPMTGVQQQLSGAAKKTRSSLIMSDNSAGLNDPTLSNAESAATHENDKQMAGTTDVIQSAINGSDALGNHPAGGCPAIINDVCESQETLNAGMQDRSENLASSSDTLGGKADNLKSSDKQTCNSSAAFVNRIVTLIESFATQPEREKPQSQIQDDSKQTFDKGLLPLKQVSLMDAVEMFPQNFSNRQKRQELETISTSTRSKSLVEDDVAGIKKSTTLDSHNDVIQSARNGSDAQETLNAKMQDGSESLASSLDTLGGKVDNLESSDKQVINCSKTSVNGMETQIGSFATKDEQEEPRLQYQDDRKQTFDKGQIPFKQASLMDALEAFNKIFPITSKESQQLETFFTSTRSKSLVEDDVAGIKKSTTLDSHNVQTTSEEKNHKEQPPMTMNLVEEEMPTVGPHLEAPGSSLPAHSDISDLNPDDRDEEEHGVQQERAVEGTSGNDGIAVEGQFEDMMDTEPTMRESKRRRAPSETVEADSIESSESSSIKRSKPTEPLGKQERPATEETSLHSGSDSAIQDQVSISAEQPSSSGTSSQHPMTGVQQLLSGAAKKGGRPKKNKENNSSPMPLTEEQKRELKETFIREQRVYIIKRNLQAILQDRVARGTITEEQRKKVEATIKGLEDMENPRYLYRLATPGETQSDKGDYRLCHEYLMKLTCSTAKKIQKSRRKFFKISPMRAPILPFLAIINKSLLDSSAKITESAIHCAQTGENTFYEVNPLKAPEPSVELLAKDIRLNNDAIGKNELTGDANDPNHLRLAVPTLRLDPNKKIDEATVETFCNRNPIAVIENFPQAVGLDLNLFSLVYISTHHPDHKFSAFRQLSQSANGNKNTKGEKVWQVSQIAGYDKTIGEYADEIKKQMELGEKLLQAVLDTDDENVMEVLMKIMEQSCAEQDFNHENDIECDRLFFWNYFGTNIDLCESKDDEEARKEEENKKKKSKKGKKKGGKKQVEEEVKEEEKGKGELKFKEQMEELKKIPTFMHPDSINNLLKYTGIQVRGVNTVQLYAKGPGNRTSAHMENFLMASINLNCGPGACIWFAVSYEYWGKIVEIVNKNHANGYHTQDYWPNEEQFLEAGIPVYKYVQQPGALVYVNTGTFHWVQSEGYCTNVSWNIGPANATQLATSVVAAEHNVACENEAIIPLRHTILNIAERKMSREDEEMFQIIRHQLALMLWHETLVNTMIDQNGAEHMNDNYSDEHIPLPCENCSSEMMPTRHYVLIRETEGNKEKTNLVLCTSCSYGSKNGKYPKLIKSEYCSYYTLERLKSIYDGWIATDGSDNNGSADKAESDQLRLDSPQDQGPSTSSASNPSGSAHSDIDNVVSNGNGSDEDIDESEIHTVEADQEKMDISE